MSARPSAYSPPPQPTDQGDGQDPAAASPILDGTLIPDRPGHRPEARLLRQVSPPRGGRPVHRRSGRGRLMGVSWRWRRRSRCPGSCAAGPNRRRGRSVSSHRRASAVTKNLGGVGDALTADRHRNRVRRAGGQILRFCGGFLGDCSLGPGRGRYPDGRCACSVLAGDVSRTHVGCGT
jgi:hypothetical protein